jgi:drug/metabolite transporter (DMT)-like permease
MPSLSFWHLVVVVLIALLVWAFVVVFGRILSRTGYSRWWLLIVFVPLLNLIMLWVFAFADWPVTRSRGQA